MSTYNRMSWAYERAVARAIEADRAAARAAREAFIASGKPHAECRECGEPARDPEGKRHWGLCWRCWSAEIEDRDDDGWTRDEDA